MPIFYRPAWTPIYAQTPKLGRVDARNSVKSTRTSGLPGWFVDDLWNGVEELDSPSTPHRGACYFPSPGPFAARRLVAFGLSSSGFSRASMAAFRSRAS
jgi:hypothetical protein